MSKPLTDNATRLPADLAGAPALIENLTVQRDAAEALARDEKEMADGAIKQRNEGGDAMSENPVLNLMRHFFQSAGFQEVPATKTYTRDDLVRAIIAQQWAVAIACCDTWGTFSSVSYIANVVSKFPCAHDVVEGMEQS